jgi:hypothetical protein
MLKNKKTGFLFMDALAFLCGCLGLPENRLMARVDARKIGFVFVAM